MFLEGRWKGQIDKEDWECKKERGGVTCARERDGQKKGERKVEEKQREREG